MTIRKVCFERSSGFKSVGCNGDGASKVGYQLNSEKVPRNAS